MPPSPTQTVNYPHPVSFRLDDTQIERVLALRASFDSNTWSEAFRWLLADPVVVERIAEKVTA